MKRGRNDGRGEDPGKVKSQGLTLAGPTREAYARGGHEANAEVTYWAKLAPGSLETVVEKTIAVLRQVFAQGET